MRSIAVLFLICLAFAGCKKDLPPDDNPNPIYNTPIQFLVNGFADISIEQYDTLQIPINIEYLSGTKQKVSLAMLGLPGDVLLSFTPQADTPTYNSIITLSAINADTGTYQIKLVAIGEGDTIPKEIPVVLHVIPEPVNPALVLVGAYTETGNCTSGSVNNTVAVTTVPGFFNKINLHQFWTGNNNVNIKADIDPATQTITIPPQLVASPGPTISGSGTYSGNTININYIVTDATIVFDTCSTVLTK